MTPSLSLSKFFNSHNPGDLRAHAMSRPGNTPSLPQTKIYHSNFSKHSQLPSPQEMSGVYAGAAATLASGVGIIHSRRDKYSLTTGELPQLIHLFHSLGLLRAT